MLVLICLAGCGCAGEGDDDRRAAEEALARELERSRLILEGSDAAVYDFEVLNTYRHDTSAFTQGLAIEGELLYEGTGLYGRSRLAKMDLATGGVLRIRELDPAYFGEGVTVMGDEVYQLTYDSNLGFVYDKNSFELERTFRYPTQGWGLTDNGEELIMSDGTSTLRTLDPATMQETGSLTVSDSRGAVENLNELEYVEGAVYANVWRTSLIAIISLESGEVTGWIDLAGIYPDRYGLDEDHVLNGIAYDPDAGRLLVTGKCWPSLYEIELVPRPQGGGGT